MEKLKNNEVGGRIRIKSELPVGQMGAYLRRGSNRGFAEVMKKISNKLHQGEITMIIFFWQFFPGIHVKHQKMKKLGWANLLKFQSTSILCHPLQTVDRNEFLG